ncbi:sensor histidine kinase (plasmid) [Diaphorobacter sp. HDW4B]|uniref:sensor histidine kinase n=1 Tax=Diaphorobacter sp. HDW4B TaxID=2714925 RepID=UPI00140B0660|nr:sensor histidine kinase [Diaphorobacter sp. HDW4B]QIL74352.1 sensor histidine kinase [Diaphorobacter sp. HDW4B]
MKSIKWTLLAFLLPTMALLMCGELWLSWRELRIAANAAYDRSLTGAIKGINAKISTESGGLGVELPYEMLEAFQLTADGKVFYRISTQDGLVTLGNADLPAPPKELELGEPVFYDSEYFGEPVRIGAYMRRLDKPLYGAQTQNLVIQVAESTEARASFVFALQRQNVLLDLLLVFVIALLMAVSIALALRPVLRVRAEVLSRARDDLAPIDPTGVPREIGPLVEAINHHLGQWVQLARSQSQFLEDASHQLRTPLAVLRTQVEYALREPELPRVRDALAAMQSGIERSTRLVNQLLALAHVNNASTEGEPAETIQLDTLVNDTARSLLSQARKKRQIVSFVAPPEGVVVEGSPVLLREAVTNLLDNAIKFAPAAGQISLDVTEQAGLAQVRITDNGPGIAAADRGHLGERFRRGKTARPGGAGLGLAIAKAIMEQHQGHLRIEDTPDGQGVSIVLELPARHRPAGEWTKENAT